jgi:hypothetical protein
MREPVKPERAHRCDNMRLSHCSGTLGAALHSQAQAAEWQ